MALRDDLLPALDAIRGIPDAMGLRLYTVTIRVRTWSGTRPGVDSSTSSDADSKIWVDAGTHRARLVQVTQRDLIANPNLQDQDVKVGPITPPYTGGGVDITVFNPTPGVSPTEVFFLVDGPGMDTGGSWFRKVAQDVSKPFSYYFTLRRCAETP